MQAIETNLQQKTEEKAREKEGLGLRCCWAQASSRLRASLTASSFSLMLRSSDSWTLWVLALLHMNLHCQMLSKIMRQLARR